MVARRRRLIHIGSRVKGLSSASSRRPAPTSRRTSGRPRVSGRTRACRRGRPCGPGCGRASRPRGSRWPAAHRPRSSPGASRCPRNPPAGSPRPRPRSRARSRGPAAIAVRSAEGSSPQGLVAFPALLQRTPPWSGFPDAPAAGRSVGVRPLPPPAGCRRGSRHGLGEGVSKDEHVSHEATGNK
jgi:hypothetical protein